MGWVLEAIYGAFAIAHDEAFAEDPFGRGLADEAIWLARVVASLTADEPEPFGPLPPFFLFHPGAKRSAAGRARTLVPLFGARPDKVGTHP